MSDAPGQAPGGPGGPGGRGAGPVAVRTARLDDEDAVLALVGADEI
ncbi:MAG: hypothetical protein F2817_16565, partial [Actinobacteria bacterium]|nr:hypothetical protein [Actinomycetota bacterium]